MSRFITLNRLLVGYIKLTKIDIRKESIFATGIMAYFCRYIFILRERRYLKKK